MRVTIVGGGIIGLLTAVECARAGAGEVTVLEQGELPNVWSTSYDRHRIMRALHRGDPVASGAAVRAQDRWVEIERLVGGTLFHRVGALTALPTTQVAEAAELVRQVGGRAEAWSAHQLAGRWPQLRVPAGYGAVLEPTAGVLLAARALALLIRWLRAQPAVRLRARQQVSTLDPAGCAVELAGGEVMRADSVVVAAGPRSPALLGEPVASGLTLFRQSMLYCRVPERLRPMWTDVPAVPALGTPDGAWLVPPVAGTPLKLSTAQACRPVRRLTDHDTPAQWRQHLVSRWTALLDGFEPGWVSGARDCYYLADSTTGGARLVQLGERAMWAYAACGGTSFKLAPVVARSLALRALGTRPPAARGAAMDGLDSALPVAAAASGAGTTPESSWIR
jgi:glycine/D-amino acid oxidase-like deaminating enzyme